MLLPRLGLQVGQRGFDIWAGRGVMNAVGVGTPWVQLGVMTGSFVVVTLTFLPRGFWRWQPEADIPIRQVRPFFFPGKELVWSTYITTSRDGFECMMVPCFLHGAGRHWGFTA